MCRFVIVVAISAALVSCVLGQTEAPVTSTPKPSNPCLNNTDLIASKHILKNCFNKTVERHLNSSAILADGDCQNATDFSKKLDDYFNALKKACNVSVDPTNIKKLVEFSLRNDSFKTFYEDFSCLKQFEVNISNTCVKDKVGFFNITKTKKHTSWTRKTQLLFSKNTCGTNTLVKNCVAVKLQSCKKHTTPDYVISLFEYVRDLGNCSQFKDTSTVPDPNGTGALAASSTPSWLTLPVMITLGIGAAVVVAAIIIIIVLKCKN